MDEQSPVGVEALGLAGQITAGQSLLHITAGEARAEALAAFLRQALPDRPVEVFPPWDCLPFDSASPTPAAMGRRMAVLWRLASARQGVTVIVPLRALLQRLPPREAVRGMRLVRGEPVDAEALQAFCLEAGYLPDDRIDEPGEVAFRNGTVEIFAAGAELPCRIDIAEGIVAAIRRFDPGSQRSVAEIDSLDLAPVTELPPSDGERERAAEHRLPQAYDRLTVLMDHLPGARLTSTSAALQAAEPALERLAEAQADAEAGGARPLAADALYLGPQDWAALLPSIKTLPEFDWQPIPAFAAERRPRNRLAGFLAGEAGRRLLLTAHSDRELRRLQRMLRQAGGEEPETVASLAAAEDLPRAALIADLERGFTIGDLTVLTAADMLGSRAEQPNGLLGPAVPGGLPEAGFQIGDTVVHEDHGLARLEGVEPLDPEAPQQEVIRLVFAKDERLLVPARDAGRIWRYGSSEAGVKLDRLDSGAWTKRREATQESLEALAAELVRLAAERAAAEGGKIQPPAAAFERFVDRFPYPATPDQRAAVRAVLSDLGSGRPMDRLLIGDVGFGKTEVALRAAAAVALAGRQVAISAPTTVLARQHFETFCRRFAPFGIEVGHLSRLVTGKAASAVKTGVAEGTVRVVVGTHALVGKDIRFADLGLLIIDEEQRFGAAQKQKLRALGQGSHVLSMSATPIPRTLQTALVGLQDMSVIATPPARRRPIRTLIADDGDATLRQALMRERRRGGQSFLVAPRIEDIAPLAERLRRLVPDLRLRIAHGGLPPEEIDATVVGFAAGDGDILLATAIIESGLDVSRANTMLVLKPALFGLAQLHQLRGRVGRGALQAYCYLLTAEGKELTEDARRRLGTLQALDRLGAGFAISAADLDRRGGGELLGERQAGHVKRVGLGLYQQMLARALDQARGVAAPPAPPQLLGEVGFIPADYVPEPESRIDLYHRLAQATGPGQLDALSDEITDRFGPLPDPVEALLRAASVRVLAGALDVEQISLGSEGLALGFREEVAPQDFDAAVRRAPDLEWQGGRLLLRRPGEDAASQLAHAADLLERLA
ncbi:MAG: box helicase domain protein [Cereibacter sp.]|jgi:transcription-repair coupling factor (superfamily II helicase)|nr:box helicase domain protein [Cereibacter sp.]